MLKVQRAAIGVKQVVGVEMGVNAMTMMAGTTSSDLETTRVLQLLNMVTPEELMDQEEYEGELDPTYSGFYKTVLTVSFQKSVRTLKPNAQSTESLLT